MFTAAFGVSKELVEPIAQDRDCLRFVLMEKPPTKSQKKTLSEDSTASSFPTACVLGEIVHDQGRQADARA